MNFDKNWEELLNKSRRRVESKVVEMNNQKDNYLENYIKKLVLESDVEDDNVWNYIYYLKNGNEYISFNKYISMHALP